MAQTNLTIVPNWQPPPGGTTPPETATVEVLRSDGGTWQASAALFDEVPAPNTPVTSHPLPSQHQQFTSPTLVDLGGPYLGVLAHGTESGGTLHSKTVAFYDCTTGASIGSIDLVDRQAGGRIYLVASLVAGGGLAGTPNEKPAEGGAG